METARLAKQDEPSFVKKLFAEHYETPSNLLFVVHANFAVSSRFHCGSQIMYSPLEKHYKTRAKVLFSKFRVSNTLIIFFVYSDKSYRVKKLRVKSFEQKLILLLIALFGLTHF